MVMRTDEYPNRRWYDRSPVSRVNSYLGQFKFIWFILAAIGLALGFKLVTPREVVVQLNARLDTTSSKLQEQIDTLKTNNQTNTLKLDILLKLQCINSQYTARDRALSGLRCNP